MESESICCRCKGNVYASDANKLYDRFSDGEEKYLCDTCLDMANKAMEDSRDFYGIDRKAYKIVLRRFRRKHKIPKFEIDQTAMHKQMIEQKRNALLRLMFIMDIRAVKRVIKNIKP
jgi:hypothetical protein